ncbi:MAG TPA: dipeptidase [Gemmatimonadales bacterium]|nr:dipeptidase [Gemmatimonadales bacterium]
MRLPVLLVLCPVLAAPVFGQSDSALEHARAILRSTPLIDGHNDLPWEIRRSRQAAFDVDAYDLSKRTPGQTDIARLRQGLVGAQFWSVYVPGEIPDSGYARVQLEQIDIARRLTAKYPNDFVLALTADDIEQAFREGRIASLIGMEGGHAIENSLGALRAYYDLGARYMTLTHNVTVDWADAALDEQRHGGLTAFGREVVREMNRLGMMIDLSHTAPSVMHDAIATSEAPVIFSHSSARALVDVPRNVPDSVLRQLPANGGVVMVTFVPEFVSSQVARAASKRERELRKLFEGVTAPAERRRIWQEYNATHPMPKATLADVSDHIEHVRRVAGADHVGIGSDFDGMGAGPDGLGDVSTFPALFAELVRRGWSDADLRKLAGENLLRTLRAVERTAHRLQRERPPSTATIEALDRP